MTGYKTMPEEKTIIGVPEDVAEKLKEKSVENVRDILDVPGRQSEIWVDGKAEPKAEKHDAHSVSQYERKLSEIHEKALAPVSSGTTVASDETAVKFDADAIRHMEDAVGRVQKLVELAQVKGVVHAVSVAEHIDAYTLDKTHDRLADELSDELRKRGMLPDAEE